jgi:hypothetical protein
MKTLMGNDIKVRTGGHPLHINSLLVMYEQLPGPLDQAFIIELLAIDSLGFVYEKTPSKNKSEPLSLPWALALHQTKITNSYLSYLDSGQNYDLKDLTFNLDTLQWQPEMKPMALLPQLKWTLKGEDFALPYQDSLFVLRIEDYYFQSDRQKFQLNGIKVTPTLSKVAFMEPRTVQTDWYQLSVDSVQLEGFDWQLAVEKQHLDLEKLGISGFEGHFYRDKRLEEDTTYKPLPHSSIVNIPIPVNIDTIDVGSSVIAYEELVEGGDRPGIIAFHRILADLYHFSNVDSNIAREPTLDLVASGNLEETGYFNLTGSFDLAHNNDKFVLDGVVGNMDLTRLNPMLEHVAFIQIKSGRNKLIRFNFNANDDYAVGEMKFYYDNLKISVLNKNTHQARGFGASFKSFFANTFIVHKRNPRLLFLRDGDIYFERLQNKSVFNYWSKSLLSGVVSSIGARNNKKEIRKMNREARRKLEASLEEEEN